MQNCFDNIIGISRSTCACLELPENSDKSTSGLYMDELPEVPVDLLAIANTPNCNADFGVLLSRARENAVKEFKRDFWIAIKAYYTQRAEAYTGLVGKAKGSTVLNIQKQMAGVKLAGKVFRGAYITVNSIKTAFNSTAVFDVQVYKQRRGELDFELVKTLEDLESEANVVKDNALTEPLVLPIWDETGKEINYFFVYQVAGGFQPLDNPISCGCGAGESAMKKYFIPYGVQGNTLDAMATSTGYAFGIILDIDVRCGSDDIICQALNRDESLKVAIEWAILRRAVINLIDGILHSKEINRYNQANREQMYADRGKLSGQYKNSVQWIAENINIGMNDCYTCNTAQEPFGMLGIKI